MPREFKDTIGWAWPVDFARDLDLVGDLFTAEPVGRYSTVAFRVVRSSRPVTFIVQVAQAQTPCGRPAGRCGPCLVRSSGVRRRPAGRRRARVPDALPLQPGLGRPDQI